MAGKPSKFSRTLAAAIAERDLPLNRLTARLKAAGKPVSVATLSYWQTGRSLPTRAKSLETLVELEKILYLSPGTLASALPEATVRWDPRRILPASEQADGVLAETCLEMAASWAKISAWDRMHVREDGSPGHEIIRQVLRSKTDGAQDLPMVVATHGRPLSPADVECVFGLELAGLRQAEAEDLVLARFRLPQPVPKNTVITTEHVVHWPRSGGRIGRLERASVDPVVSTVMEVEFAGELPERFTSFHRSWPGAEDERRAVPVQPYGRWVRSVVTHAKPGVHGLAWEW